MTDAALIQTFKSKFEWEVPRSAFDTPEGSHQFVKSEEFRACPDSEVSWELRLYPRSDYDAFSGDVSLYLSRVGPRIRKMNDPFRAKHRFGIISSDGAETNVKYWDVAFSKDELPLSEWGWPEFIRRDVLFDPTQNFFRENKLTIFCDSEVYWNPVVVVPEPTLIQDFSEMLASGDFSDVILVVGGEELKAHRNVLSARSPVFAAMFKHDMKESQTGRVEIKDLDVIAVKALLSFLYSGEVKDLEAIAEKVLPAADKYGVERLKIMCEKELFKSLKIENAADMLSLADLYSAPNLKARASEIIKSNRGEVVAQPSFWGLANSNQYGRDLLQKAVGSPKDSEEPPEKRRKLN